MSNIVEGKRVKEMSIEELSNKISNIKEIKEEDSEEDELFERLIKNGSIKGLLYFESKPVVLEKYQNAKTGFGLIVDLKQMSKENYDKVEEAVRNKCKRVCDERAKEMYNEHNKERMDF